MEPRVPDLHPNVPKTEKCDSAPKGVRSAMWEKFQALQKKRQHITNESIKAEETDSNQINSNKTKDDAIPADTSNSKPKSEHEETRTTPASTSTSTTASSTRHESGASSEQKEGWEDIKPYLNVNSHLSGGVLHAAKCKLEKEIDEAIERGDLETAESLSDQLSTRDFGKKIADAIDAKRFDHKRRKEEEISKAKKKKKLAWGFDHKERWEMKGNM